MTRLEKIKLFFQYLKNDTPQEIRNAVAAVSSDFSDIEDVIAGYIEGKGIDAAATVLLADLSGAQEQARQKAAQEQAAADLAAMAGELAAESAPEKQRELIKGIYKTAAFLEPSTDKGFQFVRMDSLQVRPPSWLIRGLIETDSFGCLYGVPASGKSFIGIEVASCVTTGTAFYGLPVKKGPVIFLAGEGQSGLARRFKAWSIARGVSLDGASLYINRGPVSLIDDGSMVQVIQALERLIVEIGRPPALAILDTWSRVLGGDDSAPSDAAAGVAALDALRSRFGNFAALVVHHEGHAKGRGRGWSGLRAAVDVELRAERGNDGVLRLESTKAKDTEPIGPMAFHFSAVELGFNDDEGNPVTSAVLTPTGWTPAPEAAVKKPVGKNQTLAMDILKQLSSEKEPVTLEVWRKACSSEGLIKQRFNEVRKSLIESGKIEINNSLVTILNPPVRNESGNGNAPYYIGGRYRPLPESDTSDEVTKSNEKAKIVTTVTGVENSPVSTPSNASNAPELFQNEKPSHAGDQ